MIFSEMFLNKFITVINTIPIDEIENMARGLQEIRDNHGRLFIIGVGGSAANASHAVNDFRKLANIEAYCPTDNVFELTAHINDDGWDDSFVEYLISSYLDKKDGILILSVGGGDLEKKISVNLVYCAEYAKIVGAKVFSIVGRTGGEVGKLCTSKIIIPPLFTEFVTPITEAVQSVILHLLVSHPLIQKKRTTW